MNLLEQLKVLRKAGHLLRDEGGIKQVRQAEMLSNYHGGVAKGLGRIAVSQHIWGRFLREEKLYQPKQPNFVAVTRMWFEAQHKWALEKAIEQLHEEGAVQSHTITKSVYEFFYPDEAYPKRELERISDDYLIVRPYFADTSKFLVATLKCDAKGASFSCKMVFPGEDGAPKEEEAKGAIVPYENHYLFIGEIKVRKAPFVFMLANCILEGQKYTKAEGTIMVGAPSYLPNASPLAIRKTNEPYESGVYSKEEMAQIFGSWDSIFEKLQRGNVHW